MNKKSSVFLLFFLTLGMVEAHATTPPPPPPPPPQQQPSPLQIKPRVSAKPQIKFSVPVTQSIYKSMMNCPLLQNAESTNNSSFSISLPGDTKSGDKSSEKLGSSQFKQSSQIKKKDSNLSLHEEISAILKHRRKAIDDDSAPSSRAQSPYPISEASVSRQLSSFAFPSTPVALSEAELDMDAIPLTDTGTSTASDDSTKVNHSRIVKRNVAESQNILLDFQPQTETEVASELTSDGESEAAPTQEPGNVVNIADHEWLDDADADADVAPPLRSIAEINNLVADAPNSEVNAPPPDDAISKTSTQPADDPNREAPSPEAEPIRESGSLVINEPSSEANTQAASEPLTPPEAGLSQQNQPHRNVISANRHIIQPAAASYIANLAAANSLFTIRLHDRTGEKRYSDSLTGQQQVTSLWLRQVGSHNNWRDSTGQVKTQSNSYVAQLGGDIVQWSTNGHNRGHLGLMAGYGNHRGNSHSSVTGSSAKATVRGYSVGLYGTWFANDTDKSGLYIDSWLQYNWFNNYVNAEKASARSYQSKGVNLSLETGYTLTTKKAAGKLVTGNAWYFQPQAQAVLMGVKADSHRQTNGDRAISRGTGNIQTRLGLRVFKKEPHVMAKGKEYAFAPFIEANWLHNTRDFSSTIGGTRTTQSGARNIGEVKVGVTGKINQKLNLWGNIGAQIGDKGYNSTSAMIGIKYSF